METKGFLTKSELSEARMYAKLDTLTYHQKKRIVRLYTKQITGRTIGKIEEAHPEFEKWVQVSVNEFRS